MTLHRQGTSVPTLSSFTLPKTYRNVCTNIKVYTTVSYDMHLTSKHCKPRKFKETKHKHATYK